ncbi:MAG: hypothetical protein A4E73_01253 [Syntrophaceae bacterium PtaU1.Bin231]|nr:MAG: hypothetical protein A4E73_01253 [Syntrophaceae bacterium PtaU1.Bin231]
MQAFEDGDFLHGDRAVELDAGDSQAFAVGGDGAGIGAIGDEDRPDRGAERRDDPDRLILRKIDVPDARSQGKCKLPHPGPDEHAGFRGIADSGHLDQPLPFPVLHPVPSRGRFRCPSSDGRKALTRTPFRSIPHPS